MLNQNKIQTGMNTKCSCLHRQLLWFTEGGGMERWQEVDERGSETDEVVFHLMSGEGETSRGPQVRSQSSKSAKVNVTSEDTTAESQMFSSECENLLCQAHL